MDVKDIKPGMHVIITNLGGREPAVVTYVNTYDMPVVRVDYADGTNGSVQPSQVLAVKDTTYAVTVSVDGTEAGTYVVDAPREGMARTLAASAYWSAVKAGTAAGSTSSLPLLTYTVKAL